MVAYAANRCGGKGYDSACVLFFFLAEEDVGHANALYVDWTKDSGRLLVSCYEPNGREASERYGTRERFFSRFEARTRELLSRDRPVDLDFVGLNLQTFLGEVRRQGAYTIRRGYPVCEAVVLAFFSDYMHHPEGTMEELERQLMDAGASERRAALLKWVRTMEGWVQENYSEVLSAKLAEVFSNSNVARVEVAYGDVKVKFRN
jgi:hypothetical protein